MLLIPFLGWITTKINVNQVKCVFLINYVIETGGEKFGFKISTLEIPALHTEYPILFIVEQDELT